MTELEGRAEFNLGQWTFRRPAPKLAPHGGVFVRQSFPRACRTAGGRRVERAGARRRGAAAGRAERQRQVEPAAGAGGPDAAGGGAHRLGRTRHRRGCRRASRAIDLCRAPGCGEAGPERAGEFALLGAHGRRRCGRRARRFQAGEPRRPAGAIPLRRPAPAPGAVAVGPAAQGFVAARRADQCAGRGFARGVPGAAEAASGARRHRRHRHA